MARVVLAGYLVRNPLGGYVWQAGHYLLGLRALGHDAWFYEDTGHFALAYNPLTNDYGPRYEHGLAATADFLSSLRILLANLSGFDGSPESMRRLQLEYGAEIGRAVVNFQGPIAFCVVSRYHGGAFVVFARTLTESIEIAAIEGARASVIGGAPAAAVVFAREVETRTRKDPRVLAAEKSASRGHARGVAQMIEAVRSEKLGEVGEEYDRVHSVERALKVGSLDRIIAPRELRPYLIDVVERGIARFTKN